MILIDKFEVGDKVKINYFYDTYAYNGKIGTIKWLHDYHYYPHGDLSEIVKRVQGIIQFEDGHEEAINDFYHKGGRSVLLVSKGGRNQGGKDTL